jgi:EAL domain-containing protein (putative c-di-GMP-specific phosphodiesterase class I)
MSSINNLAHALNMRTVAEHVEDEATSLLVNKMGIDSIQGFYLGVPTDIEKLPQLINPSPVGEIS